VAIDQLGSEIVEAPLTGNAIMFAGFAGGQGDNFHFSSGGKAPWPTGPRSILQASETVLKKACVPQSDGVASAAELIGDLQVGWLILACQPQDQPTAKDQGLRRRVGSGESLQSILCFAVQDNPRRKGFGMTDILAQEIEAICQFDVNPPFCLRQLPLRRDL
jgi:hypothetical protein